MSARDEILKAADDPGPSLATRATPPAGIPPVRRRPPTQPPPIPPQAQRSGEFSGRRKAPSELMPAVPSMIVRDTPSTKLELPVDATPPPPSVPTGVLDLSSNVPADTWMANPDTDLLSGHRLKGVANLVIALVLLAGLGIGIFWLMNRDDGEGRASVAPTDAAIAKVAIDAAVPLDAPNSMSKDDIVAISRFGFFSITATAKTTIYVDGKLIGETPLTRLPLAPGPHKIKAVGPRGKTKNLKITIYGGKDTDEGEIEWDK
jgi:hypothetical protein